jgi:hypothetical protein
LLHNHAYSKFDFGTTKFGVLFIEKGTASKLRYESSEKISKISKIESKTLKILKI